MTRDEAVAVVLDSYRQAIAEAGVEGADEPTEATSLVGPGSLIDSMGLVSVVLDVEQRLEEQFGVAVSLMNEQALSRRNSPFRTVGSLADYVGETAGA